MFDGIGETQNQTLDLPVLMVLVKHRIEAQKSLNG
jgi:hypothetical protein